MGDNQNNFRQQNQGYPQQSFQDFSQQGFQQQGFQDFSQQGFPQQQSFGQQQFQQQSFQDFSQQGFQQQSFQQQPFQQQGFQDFSQQGFQQQQNGNLMQARTPNKKSSSKLIIVFIVLIVLVVIMFTIRTINMKKKANQQQNTGSQVVEQQENDAETQNNNVDDSSSMPNDNQDTTEDSQDTVEDNNTSNNESTTSDVVVNNSVDLNHGESYNYVLGNNNYVILNERVELFKQVKVKEPNNEIQKPSKGNVYLAIFLTVTNKSEEAEAEGFFNILFQGYSNNINYSTAYTTLDELEGYSLDTYISRGQTKKICMFYEVPKEIQDFELRDNLGTSFKINLVADDAKGEEER